MDQVMSIFLIDHFICVRVAKLLDTSTPTCQCLNFSPALLSCSKNWIDLYVTKVWKYIREMNWENVILLQAFLYPLLVFFLPEINTIFYETIKVFVEILWLPDTNLFDRTGTWENERNSGEKIFLQFYTSLQLPQSLFPTFAFSFALQTQWHLIIREPKNYFALTDTLICALINLFKSCFRFESCMCFAKSQIKLFMV